MLGQPEVENSVGEWFSLSDSWRLVTRSALFARRFRPDSRDAENRRMLRGGSLREHTFANETPVHVLTNDDEYLSDPAFGGTRCATAALVVGSYRR
jgi:hypothetical protein